MESNADRYTSNSTGYADATNPMNRNGSGSIYEPPPLGEDVSGIAVRL